MKLSSKVAAAALLILSGAPAFAADFGGVPAPTEAATQRLARPAYSSFDGFFVGGFVGDTIRPSKTINALTPGTLPASSAIIYPGRGGQSFMFGAFAGYNATIGNILLGAELIGDISPNGGHWSGNGQLVSGIIPPATTQRAAVNVNGAIQTRGKIGYVFTPQIAAYTFAGVGLDFVSYRFANAGVRVPTPSYAASNATLGTYGVGAGLEWAVVNNVALRAEYEWRRSFDNSIWAGTRYDTGRHIVRVGASYLFGR
jgi:opacity protein-like surface antigen